MMNAIAMAQRLHAALVVRLDTPWQLVNVPNDEKLPLPRGEMRIDASDTITENTSKSDSDTIGRIPVTNNSRLLSTREPHGRDGDYGQTSYRRILLCRLTEAGIGHGLEHAGNESQSKQRLVVLSSRLCHEENSPEEDVDTHVFGERELAVMVSSMSYHIDTILTTARGCLEWPMLTSRCRRWTKGCCNDHLPGRDPS